MADPRRQRHDPPRTPPGWPHTLRWFWITAAVVVTVTVVLLAIMLLAW